MTFCTNDKQSAKLPHLRLLFPAFFLELLVKLIKPFTCLQKLFVFALYEAGCKSDSILIIAFLLHSFLGFKFRVAAQNDVGTSSCHVGSDRDCSKTTCLCDDLCFLFMMLCI